MDEERKTREEEKDKIKKGEMQDFKKTREKRAGPRLKKSDTFGSNSWRGNTRRRQMSWEKKKASVGKGDMENQIQYDK